MYKFLKGKISVTSGRPPGVQEQSIRRPPAARFPGDGNTARVIKLAVIWGAAVGVAAGNRFRAAPWLRGAAPWDDPKQVRRWNVFVILDARLQEWGADPREFCAAAMDHFRWMVETGKVWALRPNVFQVCGEHGRRYWLEWRRRRAAEGAGSEQWVAGEAARATATSREKLAVDLLRATEECRGNGGPAWAVTPAWGAEVLFLIWAYEPIAAQAVEALLKGELVEMSAAIAAARCGFEAIRRDDRRREWLLTERRRIFGHARPALLREPESLPARDVGAAEERRGRAARQEFLGMERSEQSERALAWDRARRRLRGQREN